MELIKGIDQELNSEKINNLDFNQLQREILQDLRGEKTRIALSRELGYGYNQFARWERGLTTLRWNDFLEICAVKNIDFQEIFYKCFAISSENLSSTEKLARALMNMSGFSRKEEFAKKCQITVQQIESWFYQRGKISFVDVLQILFYLKHQGFFSWLTQFVCLDRLPSIKKIGFIALNEQALQCAFPFTSAIMAALQTEEYRRKPHSSGRLAKLSGVPSDIVKDGLRLLEMHGHIFFENGIYQVKKNLVDFQGVGPDEFCRLARYWNQRVLERFQTSSGRPENKRKTPTVFNLRVSPVSQNSTKKIIEVLHNCHNEISTIVDQDNGPYDEARVLVMNFFCIDDRPDELCDDVVKGFSEDSR